MAAEGTGIYTLVLYVQLSEGQQKIRQKMCTSQKEGGEPENEAMHKLCANYYYHGTSVTRNFMHSIVLYRDTAQSILMHLLVPPTTHRNLHSNLTSCKFTFATCSQTPPLKEGQATRASSPPVLQSLHRSCSTLAAADPEIFHGRGRSRISGRGGPSVVEAIIELLT